ncbi:hypothetical protein TNCV_4436441 [Trichonephila clavipes]|nr:hypothetical protein TNCV_4436441 [Trichonephila clavipes]
MAPQRPRKSAPTKLTTDGEDMIMYDMQAEELEPNPEDKFAMKECFVNNPSKYMRALTLWVVSFLLKSYSKSVYSYFAVHFKNAKDYFAFPLLKFVRSNGDNFMA